MTKERPIAILDIETDPFRYGRIPMPFAVGIYTASSWRSFWGDTCIEDSLAYLAAWKHEHIVCAHNGGKFDFMYYLNAISGNLRIINGRIVSAKCAGHEFRDSYAILPFPLRDYKKDEIDYKKFEVDVRERHKTEILDYLHGDCLYLYRLVSRFYGEFSQKYLTVGSAAMSQIKARHQVSRTKLSFDKVFRSDFFFGGRVECFDSGIVEGELSIHDVNSMYPDRMRNCEHPSDDNYNVGDTLTPDTCFLVVSGTNRGAFPVRNKEGGLSFGSSVGTYSVTRHEFDAALTTGTFDLERIHTTYDFPVRTSYADFVDYAFAQKADGKESGDSAKEIAWKFISNSGYGKFAQNPANFSDWKIATLADRPMEPCRHCKGTGLCWWPNESDSCYQCRALNEFLDCDGICMFCEGDGLRWKLHEHDSNNPDGPMLWYARTFAQSYYNVATGASITGAARAKLLIGLSQADDPVYCDTDSIITRGEFHGPAGKALGEWKHEGNGVLAAIGGKKLYCIYNDREPDLSEVDQRKYPWMMTPVWYKRCKLWPIKKAHKGMRLTPTEILSIAQGNEIEVPNDAPSFSLTLNPSRILTPKQTSRMFIKRRARRTA